MSTKYWREAIEYIFDAHEIVVAPDKLDAIAHDLAGAEEEKHQFSYVPENPLVGEVKELKAKLKDEREKVVCRSCNATGEMHTYGGTFMSSGPCFDCRGEGYRKP